MMRTMRQQQISQEGQIYIAEHIVKFKEYFVEFFKKFDASKKMTIEDIEVFKRGLEGLRDPPEA